MKKTAILGILCLFFVSIVLVLSSCGSSAPVKDEPIAGPTEEYIPTKEMDNAKMAIDKAKEVEADKYAPEEFNLAVKEYDEASKYMDSKKYSDAKDKAISSEKNANAAYDKAVKNRAEYIYNLDKELLKTAEDNFAAIIVPDDYSKAKSDFDDLTDVYESGDYEKTYTDGNALKDRLNDIIDYCKNEIARVSEYIKNVRNKYDNTIKDEYVNKYSLDEMTKALGLLDEADRLLNAGKTNEAYDKAKEAEELIDYASQKAQEEYARALKDSGQQIDEDPYKQKARETIEEAKRKLQLLKEKQQKENSSLDTLNSKEFASLDTGFMVFTQQAGKSDDTVEEPTMNDDGDETADEFKEKYTIEMVENYINLAEQAFDDEEYLEAIDLAREAIRIADILLAMTDEEEEQPTTVQEETEKWKSYVVKLNIKKRDCLWRIAEYMYDNPWLWPEIYKANKDQIENPDIIYPGQELKIPPIGQTSLEESLKWIKQNVTNY